MQNPHPKILVIGINQTLVWNVSRSLSVKGLPPVVLASQGLAPLKMTSDCTKYIHWTDVKLDKNDEIELSAINQIKTICDQYNINLVIPADYESALLLGLKSDELEIPTCLIPKAKTIKQLHNKWSLYQLLTKLGVDCPESEIIVSNEMLLKTKLNFPIITKPLNKWASVGFEVHETPETLLRRVNTEQLKSGYPLIAQTLAPGWDVGLSFLANKGEIVAYCMFHANKKRTRTFFDDPSFLVPIKKIINATQYSGVGNFDAIYNPETKTYQILELNPRFWASQLYATNAQLNFPYLVTCLDIWKNQSILKATLGDAKTIVYERVMSFLTRLSNNIYNHF